MHSSANEIVLTRDAKPLIRRASRNQDSVRAIVMPGVGRDHMVPLIIGHPHDVLGREQFHAKTFGLLNDALSKLRPGHPFWEPRIVVQALGDASLSAKPTPLDD